MVAQWRGTGGKILKICYTISKCQIAFKSQFFFRIHVKLYLSIYNSINTEFYLSKFHISSSSIYLFIYVFLYLISIHLLICICISIYVSISKCDIPMPAVARSEAKDSRLLEPVEMPVQYNTHRHHRHMIVTISHKVTIWSFFKNATDYPAYFFLMVLHTRAYN